MALSRWRSAFVATQLCALYLVQRLQPGLLRLRGAECDGQCLVPACLCAAVGPYWQSCSAGQRNQHGNICGGNSTTPALQCRQQRQPASRRPVLYSWPSDTFETSAGAIKIQGFSSAQRHRTFHQQDLAGPCTVLNRHGLGQRLQHLQQPHQHAAPSQCRKQ